MWKNKNPGRNLGLQQELTKPGTFLRSPPSLYSANIYKIDERHHFHYDIVELGPVNVEVLTTEVELNNETEFDLNDFFWTFSIESNDQKWIIKKTFAEFTEFDGQLHRCVFDRRHSHLIELRLLCFNQTKPLTKVCSLSKLMDKDPSPSPTSTSNSSSNVTTTTAALSWAISSPIKVRSILFQYCTRLSQLTGSIIKCFPVLKFLELDSRGNHFIPIEQLHINTPAMAVAIVIKDFTPTRPEELSLKIGDFVSIIEMDSPEQNDDNFWKGKLTISNNKSRISSSRISLTNDFNSGHLFSIGYFPSSYVKLFTGKNELDGYYSTSLTKQPYRKSIIKRPIDMLKLPSSPQLLFWKKKTPVIAKEITDDCKVFGIDLAEYIERTNCDVPMILTKCAEIIETHGLVTGIYRQCGIQSNIQRLKWEFDTGQQPLFDDPKILRDIHCVSSLLKQYFRQLPNPLFTYELYNDFMNAYQNDSKTRLYHVREVVKKLPLAHYRTAQVLMKHLHKMCQYKSLTDMNSNNLAIVWSPNLFRIPPSEDNDGQLLRGISLHNRICNFMILNSEKIFDNDNKENSSHEKVSNSLDPQTSSQKDNSEDFNVPKNRICVDVNGGPAFLPSDFHTVIDRSNKNDKKWKNLIRNSSIRSTVSSFLNHRRRSIDTDKMSSNNTTMNESFSSSFTTNGIRRCTSVISNLTSNMEALGSNVARHVRTFSVRKFKKKRDASANGSLAHDDFVLLNITRNNEDTYVNYPIDKKEEIVPKIKFEAGMVEEETPKPKKVMFESSGMEERFIYEVNGNSDDPDADKLSTDISSAESLPLDISRYDNVPSTNLFFS